MMHQIFSFSIFLFIFTPLSINATKIPSNVIELNERFLDVMGQGFWFVEFYAPWCAHCKKLMPVWELVGHALADKQSPVRVAKVDCTRFSIVPSTLGIRGYPTIIFFRNGVQIHYEGERRKEDMVNFAEKCAGPVVDKIQSKAHFTELLKSTDREPFFLFFDPTQSVDVPNSQEKTLRQQYENASDTLFTEVRFFEAVEHKLLPESVHKGKNHSRILVFKDKERHVEFESSNRDDDENDQQQNSLLLDWIQKERWPLLPLISVSNLHSIAGSTAKKLVLIPVEPIDRLNASTPSGSFFAMIRRVADDVRNEPELNANFQFGWLEGDQITNGIVMGQLTIPNLVVFNLSSYEFYLNDDRPDQMTAQSTLVFLQNVHQGFVQVQGGRAWITRLRRMVYDISTNVYDMFQHQPILTVCLFGVPLAFFSIITYSICSADFSVDRDELYPDDEDDDEEDEDEAGYDVVQQREALDVPADHEKAD